LTLTRNIITISHRESGSREFPASSEFPRERETSRHFVLCFSVIGMRFNLPIHKRISDKKLYTRREYIEKSGRIKRRIGKKSFHCGEFSRTEKTKIFSVDF
jgi:hypothetical protein